MATSATGTHRWDALDFAPPDVIDSISSAFCSVVTPIALAPTAVGAVIATLVAASYFKRPKVSCAFCVASTLAPSFAANSFCCLRKSVISLSL